MLDASSSSQLKVLALTELHVLISHPVSSPSKIGERVRQDRRDGGSATQLVLLDAAVQDVMSLLFYSGSRRVFAAVSPLMLHCLSSHVVLSTRLSTTSAEGEYSRSPHENNVHLRQLARLTAAIEAAEFVLLVHLGERSHLCEELLLFGSLLEGHAPFDLADQAEETILHSWKSEVEECIVGGVDHAEQCECVERLNLVVRCIDDLDDVENRSVEGYQLWVSDLIKPELEALSAVPLAVRVPMRCQYPLSMCR